MAGSRWYARWCVLVACFWWLFAATGTFTALGLIGEASGPGTLDRLEIQLLVARLLEAPLFAALGIVYWRRRALPPPEHIRGAKGLLWDFLGFALMLLSLASYVALVGFTGHAVAGFILSSGEWTRAGIALVVCPLAALGARYFRRKRLVVA